MKKIIIVSLIIAGCFGWADAVFLYKSTITAVGGKLDYQAGNIYVGTPVLSTETANKAYVDAAGVANHQLSCFITGYPFISSTTPMGLYQIPFGYSGTVNKVIVKFATAPSEDWKIRFKDTSLTSSSYDWVGATVSFTVGVSSYTISGINHSVSGGDNWGIDMFDINLSTMCGKDFGITTIWSE